MFFIIVPSPSCSSCRRNSTQRTPWINRVNQVSEKTLVLHFDCYSFCMNGEFLSIVNTQRSKSLRHFHKHNEDVLRHDLQCIQSITLPMKSLVQWCIDKHFGLTSILFNTRVHVENVLNDPTCRLKKRLQRCRERSVLLPILTKMKTQSFRHCSPNVLHNVPDMTMIASLMHRIILLSSPYLGGGGAIKIHIQIWLEWQGMF